jgi:hypothetical protein
MRKARAVLAEAIASTAPKSPDYVAGVALECLRAAGYVVVSRPEWTEGNYPVITYVNNFVGDEHTVRITVDDDEFNVRHRLAEELLYQSDRELYTWLAKRDMRHRLWQAVMDRLDPFPENPPDR